jgi:Rieske 2Fe-2S family protein
MPDDARQPAAVPGLDALIARQRPGFALEQPFYADPDIYRLDIERIFFHSWLYVGHVSQLPEPGNYFLFELAGESVILVRGRDGEIRALLNVCRHRGSRVCWHARGRAKSFVCPYHGWGYALDGSLRAARLMPEDFDKTQYGLHGIAAHVFHGMIFINFSDQPASFDKVEELLDPCLAPFDIAHTKVANSEVYPIDANWKLAVENYIECYHCAPAHPEFSKSHAIKVPRAQFVDLQAALDKRAYALGLSSEMIGTPEMMSADVRGLHYFFDRYPLFEGYVSGTEDGKPAAPLLGEIADYDGGASNLTIGPASYFLIYSDHVVVYRFTPSAPQVTDCEIVWLVRQDAVEGRDYDLEHLTWLWHVTTLADKAIIEHNQAGVNSRFYRPGPYSPMENFATQFMAWYLKAIR